MARLDAKWYNFWGNGQTWYHFWQDAKSASGNNFTQDLSDSVTVSESVAKSLVVSSSDSVSLNDSIGKSFVSIKEDAVSVSESVAKSTGLNKIDSISVSDGYSKESNSSLGLSESVSVTDEIFINLTPGTVSTEGGGEQKKKIDVDERAEHLSAIIKNDQDIIDVIKIFIQCQ